ncbi:MAG: RluA family pseudouridine synthase, partial [Methylocystaceae bacterium]
MLRVEVITTKEEQAGERVDALLARELPKLSRTYIQELASANHLLVNGTARRASYRVKAGDQLELNIPEPVVTEIVAEDIPIDIVFEDEDILVINKPQGMVVHPAHGHRQGTLVNALLGQVDDLSGINGELRPGIVHRIDKDTSGLLVVAKNDIAHRQLAENIKEHDFTREYIALVHGRVAANIGTIDAPVGRDPRDRKKMAVIRGGRSAVSHYQVEARYQDYTLLKVTLETGRTHQIRTHLAYIKHPVVGDPMYGPR